jgi:H+/Cl- antiporter ClcA
MAHIFGTGIELEWVAAKAASIFAWVGRLTRKIVPEANFQTFLTAGAAAGVAAAFMPRSPGSPSP